MLDLVGKNQRAGLELVVLIARHGKTGIDHANVSALDILDHQVQPIQARTQRHGVLVDRLHFQGLLEEGFRKVFRDGRLESCHDAAGQRAHAPEDIHGRGVNSIFGLERELTIGNLNGYRNENGIVGHLQEVGAVEEAQLVADNARGHQGFEILELHFGRLIDFGVKLEAVEFIHACRRAAQGGRQVRAVGAGEAISLGGHAHGFHQAQARARHVQERIFFRGIHGQVIFA